jgi:hypothetical protein
MCDCDLASPSRHRRWRSRDRLLHLRPRPPKSSVACTCGRLRRPSRGDTGSRRSCGRKTAVDGTTTHDVAAFARGRPTAASTSPSSPPATDPGPRRERPHGHSHSLLRGATPQRAKGVISIDHPSEANDKGTRFRNARAPPPAILRRLRHLTFHARAARARGNAIGRAHRAAGAHARVRSLGLTGRSAQTLKRSALNPPAHLPPSLFITSRFHSNDTSNPSHDLTASFRPASSQ